MYAALGLDTQVQLQFPVDTVDPFMVPTKSFHIAQVQEAQAKSPAFVCCSEAQQPIRDLLVLAG